MQVQLVTGSNVQHGIFEQKAFSFGCWSLEKPVQLQTLRLPIMLLAQYDWLQADEIAGRIFFSYMKTLCNGFEVIATAM